MGLTKVTGGGIQPTILDPIQNLYTGSTVVFTVTVASKDTTHRYNGQGSSNGYKIDGKFAPFLVLTPGVTYKFDQADNSNSGHPLRFYKDAAKVTAYTTNVTTNGTAGSSGAYTQIVTGDATPTILYYQCSAHGLMGNAVQTNGLASSVPDDGSITTAKLAANAVTTAKIDPLAVTNGKIADNAVTTAKIVDNAVNNSKLGNDSVTGSNIADNAVATEHITDSSVTAAKLASGVQTTINNNADNRVITGSGTANTLNAESSVTIDSGGTLSVQPSASGIATTFASAGTTFGGALKLQNTTSSNHDWIIGVGGGDGSYVTGRGLFVRDQTTGANPFIITTGGRIGIGVANPSNLLHVKGSGHDKLLLETTGTAHSVGVQMKHASGNAAEQTWQLQTNGGASTQRDLSVRDATAGTFIATFRKGGGITFNGDTAAANALDDYEEGTFTATYSVASGSITNLTQSGIYTKIGKIVHIMFSCSANGSNSPSGQVTITGLPFSADVPNANGARGGGGVVFAGYHAAPELSTCQFSGTTIHLRLNNNTTLQANTSGNGFGYNAFQISGFGTYMTSA